MKNYTEEEKEMINGLLESYTDDYWISGGKHMSIRSESCLEHFQEANGLTPKLEIGKWYNSEDSHLVCVKQVDGLSLLCFGFGVWPKKWSDKIYWSDHTDGFTFTPATNEEVSSALTKETDKRGYVLGGEIVSFTGGTSKHDQRWPTYFKNGEFLWNGSIVMKDGVWAEIVKTTTKMSVAELEAAHGYTNLEITK
jgi:hypothetical protein